MLLVALLVVAMAPPAQADIYRYVDGDGVEHYSNVKPPGSRWQRVVRGSGPVLSQRKHSRQRRKRRAPDPGRLSRYDGLISEAARLYQLPPAFVRAVVRVESNFYSDAVSRTGAMGLMQLMPGTARGMGVEDPFDPRQNVLGGTRFLRVLANKFNGDLVLTIAAYNAGQGAVRKYGGIPPYAETQRYVKRVLKHYYAFKQGSPSPAQPKRPIQSS